MVEIDAHHHLWRFDAREYGWIDEGMSVLRRHFLQAEMTAAGVTGDCGTGAADGGRDALVVGTGGAERLHARCRGMGSAGGCASGRGD